MVHSVKALKIRVSGIVQGVGFRPFIYRIAVGNNLKGYVLNLGGSEVEIWVEGEADSLKKFLRDLESKKPPPAVLDDIEVEEVRPVGYNDFKILKSGNIVSKYSMIPPDIGICDYCLKEILDPSSRWYRYPFNSCAWCGPRFTVMKRVPYDRENTSMIEFPLCEECLNEYRDPSNIRRYHIQGISCPKCGPRVFLLDRNGDLIDVEDPLVESAKIIDEGRIVAIKGLGGFHIAALASDDDVVALLRKRKRRPQKPFALMALDLSIVEKISSPTRTHIELLTSPQKPIVLIPKKENTPVSSLVAPGLSTLGIMLPYTGLHYLLLKETRDKYLVMTSGNRKGLPISKTIKDALRELRDFVDYFLVHNREIVNRADDSVVRLSNKRPVFLRRSRGYAPKWIKTPFRFEKVVVAMGAQIANAGAVAFDRYIVPTQYIGDMENYQVLKYLEEALNFLVKSYKLDLNHAVFVSDMHPAYDTTRLAREWALKYDGEHITVQHHHAHIASVMASLGLKPGTGVIGIAIDGVGYGVDGNIWGGEVMYVEYEKYIRLAHLEYQPMPGGDRATRYPARIALGIIAEKLGESYAVKYAKDTGLYKGLPYGDKELQVVLSQLSNCPRVSSIGRFLDSVSALLGVCYARTYEGEPAIKLEDYAIGGSILNDLTIEIDNNDEQALILTGDLFLKILEKLRNENRRDLAFTVQYQLGYTLGYVAKNFLREYNTKTIIVSGGAAVNEIIMNGIYDAVGDKNIVIRPSILPPGDGGISTGQVAIANFML